MHRTYGLINHSEKGTSGKTEQIRKENQWSHQTNYNREPEVTYQISEDNQ
jgi:L,D-peptidoglycan transpeptidase YkuD (ErfK/YbiS/YcfS/YnhG family)